MAKAADYPALPLGTTDYRHGQTLRVALAKVVSHGQRHPASVAGILNSLHVVGDIVQSQLGIDPLLSTTVQHDATIPVKNSAGTVVAGVHTADVVAGALEDVNLAATVAPVVNGQALTGVTPSGTFTTTVTFTVADGVITAIVLS